MGVAWLGERDWGGLNNVKWSTSRCQTVVENKKGARNILRGPFGDPKNRAAHKWAKLWVWPEFMWSPVLKKKMAVLSWSAWCWVVWWLGFWFWCTRWCNGCCRLLTRPLTANFQSWLAQTRWWVRDDRRGLQGSEIRDTSSAKLRRCRPTRPAFSNGASGKCSRLCPRNDLYIEK